MRVQKRKSAEEFLKRPRRSPRLNAPAPAPAPAPSPSSPSLSTYTFFAVDSELDNKGFVDGGKETPASIIDLLLSVCTGLSQPGYLSIDDEHQLDTDAEVVAEAVGDISNESALANSYSASNSSLNPQR